MAGGIPLIRALRESLAGEPIRRVLGIVNGTTNYILTKMSEEGADYADALSEAQRLGYAEADPTADVEGYDAGAKAAIIASIAFGVGSWPATSTTRASAASPRGHRRRPPPGLRGEAAAIAEQEPTRARSRSGPPGHGARPSHPLASVRESFNAVFVEGDAVG